MTSFFPKRNSINNEIDFKQKAANAIKEEYGDEVWYYLPSDRFRRGVPDILLCFFGYFVAIELKMPQSKEVNGSPIQQYNLSRIQTANGFSFVATDMASIMDGLKNIYNVINKI
jgi:hypothetical protein